MKAMIFAAGLGTRLRPLTNEIPKALVPVEGIPLLELAIRRIAAVGIREIVINVHHFAEKVIDFIQQNDQFGLKIHISDERDQILETGGGLLKAAPILGNTPFLVVNADILSNLDFNKMIAAHQASKAIATLAIRQRTTSRYLLFDAQYQLVGWENVKTGEQRISRASAEQQQFAFSGMHVIDPQIFDLMPKQISKFSIIDTYLEVAKTHKILGYPHDDDLWLDVGKPDQLAKASGVYKQIFPSLESF
ncbi:MAG: nucleotidyltransferase family protein [Bacteroidota bacterium]